MTLETFLGSSAAKLLTDAVTGKWKERRKVHGEVELQKRRIMAAQFVSNIDQELHGLRNTFVEYGLADKSDANRGFFDRWLSDVAVELGWNRSSWTNAKIAELRADMAKIRA